jgi:hypothetical protein
MKTKTFSAIGGWNSFLFCIGMYVVALFFSIFVCSSVFYAINGSSSSQKTESAKPVSLNSAKQVLASVNK